MRDDIIGQLPLGYDREQPLQLKSISYRKQMVGGYNYFIKVGSTIHGELNNVIYFTSLEYLYEKTFEKYIFKFLIAKAIY